MVNRVANICLPLFVPGYRIERVQKAISAGPDAVLVDLEDAVSPQNKDLARRALSLISSEQRASLPLLVRINGVGTPWHEHDLAAVSQLRPDAIVLPKSEAASDIEAIGHKVGLPVIALVESAVGLQNVLAIAKASSRLAFGSIDFAADLSMGHTRQSLLFARSQIVLASRLAMIGAPLDGVTTAIHDEPAIIDDCAHAAELGFGGKLLIHPAQIEPARRGFCPTDNDVRWAERVMDAVKDGNAAISVDGAMVDAPVVMRAQQILSRAMKI